MIIRLKIDRQIVWPLVALYMLQFFFGAHKVVYVVSLIWLASLDGKGKLNDNNIAKS